MNRALLPVLRVATLLGFVGCADQLQTRSTQDRMSWEDFYAMAQGWKTPDGYYNLERMLKVCTGRGVPVGTCMDARGMTDGPLVEGVHRSTLAELTEWTLWAGKVITF